MYGWGTPSDCSMIGYTADGGQDVLGTPSDCSVIGYMADGSQRGLGYISVNHSPMYKTL